MIVAFIIWSIVAIVFLAIGINCHKSSEAIGFFTFVEPPKVVDVKSYNKAVGKLWFVVAVLFELIGVPFLFLKQHSPYFILLTLEVMFLVIAMAIVYLKIEKKYRN